MSNYSTIGLYPHNVTSYNLIKNSFESNEKIIGIVHATGTGKSYNALQLAYDNQDKKIIYIVPSIGIIENITKIIENNQNLNLKRDFSNIEFKTYQSFIYLTKDEIAKVDCDLLIVDEFHHIGAPIWGEKLKIMIETHPNMKVFGMTAYTVRDRGTSYERDMTNPDADEIFSNKIVSRYDLCDAMIDGVLPKPIYRSAYINLIGLEKKLEEKVKTINANTDEYKEYLEILEAAKKRINEAPSISELLKKNIKPNGKYIYFCPPCSEMGVNDIETIKNQAIEWFKQFVNEEDITIYTSTHEMGTIGKKNRNAFYNDVTLDGNDVSNKLRIMFAVNQYNEGIHAPNIDGVIMGRGTSSDIVYFEQLGRALSVRGNTKDKFDELNKYSIEQLKFMCCKQGINFKDDVSKEDIIEKLISPVVIDLVNNYAFIKELENNLKDRIRKAQDNKNGNYRDIKIKEASFDIEIENQELFETLQYVMHRLNITWEYKYELAKSYYAHHGDLDIPRNFKTLNGYEYDENGIHLGNFLTYCRQCYRNTKLSEEKIELLKKIGMNFEFMDNDELWNNKYTLAKAYYEHHNDLKIPLVFKTINGYEYDENGLKLGGWISDQREKYHNGRLSKTRYDKMMEIGMRFASDYRENNWNQKYELAKKYFEYYGDLRVPFHFITENGIDYSENGVTLGRWISDQRSEYRKNRISKDRIDKLNQINMVWLALAITEKQMKETITSKNQNKKIAALHNIIYSLLNNYDSYILPPQDELADKFISELCSAKVMRKVPKSN